MVKECKFCGISFDKPRSMASHIGSCKFNPNYKGRNEKLRITHKEIARKNLQKLEEKYYKNFKRCRQCEKIIHFEKRATEFCNSSCSATFNNKNNIRTAESKLRQAEKLRNNENLKNGNKNRKKKEKILFDLKCFNCGNDFKHINKNRVFCSRDCLKNGGFSKVYKKSYDNGREVAGGAYVKWIEVICSIGKIKVQGSYEQRTCLILDKMKENKEILNWEYTKDRIKYKDFDNKNKNYILDFKVFVDKDVFYYIETKGFVREVDKLKWGAVINSGFDLKVWFNEDIIEEEKRLKLIS